MPSVQCGNSTPWEELRQLAAASEFKGHYLHDPQNMPELQPAYIELARTRSYDPDNRRVAVTFNDDIAHSCRDAELKHSDAGAYGFLESLGAKLIPHGSQGTPDYTSVANGELARGEGELDQGHFFDHLVGNEQCLREWQKSDGDAMIDDAVCLAGLFHSIYGTQGYQASQFPIQKRQQIIALIGPRAERLVYWTCGMERSTWRMLILANKGLMRGATPVGTFSGRRSALGKQSYPTPWTGAENWSLTAQEFTDMCAVQLSHVLRQANNGSTMTPGDEALQIMADHLGGAAHEQYSREVQMMVARGETGPNFGRGGTPADLASDKANGRQSPGGRVTDAVAARAKI